MIVNACGLVLTRRNWNEADRLAVLFTETMGKLPVRFTGVNKPQRKLKALSEPMVWGEYRLHLSPRGDWAKAIGGRIIDSFPGIRGDLSRTIEALTCCELLMTLSVDRSPNPEKYHLIASALTALEGGSASPWLATAYGLKLLSLAGYSIREMALTGDDRPLWSALHEAEFPQLNELPWRPEMARRFQEIVCHHVEANSGLTLKCREFSKSL